MLTSCGTYKTQTFSDKIIPIKPNYELESSWAVLPSKYSDDFKKYASNNIDTLKADVFYIYPTLNTSKKDIRWNVPITDKEQKSKIINKAVLFQASAFALSGKMYVPLYRQAHYRSFVKDYKSEGKNALDLAYEDVKEAFKVYLKNYNNNRPIIIAGHSQGARHGVQLLKDFFDNSPLQEKLIAAYLPGIKILPDEFRTVRPMSSPREVGGFVSWNTFKKGKYPKNKYWYKGAVTSNPITWDEKLNTSIEQHKGFLYSDGKLYTKALKIDVTNNGLIWSTNPKFPLRFFMSFLKNYHSGDINLFWQDVRENSLLRTQEWFDKNNK
ncbi:DUF3089 domain-containing protein [Tenacibaculum crassostreae]|uniref:DUF3089 domain-containing protein n=1 Tax=Tenacibaculum crassostreae TaxID=502683 RepID=UPI0038B6ADED